MSWGDRISYIFELSHLEGIDSDFGKKIGLYNSDSDRMDFENFPFDSEIFGFRTFCFVNLNFVDFDYFGLVGPN